MRRGHGLKTAGVDGCGDSYLGAQWFGYVMCVWMIHSTQTHIWRNDIYKLYPTGKH